MDTINQNSEKISLITGEFNSPELEKTFFVYMIGEIVQHFRRTILFISLVFFLFIIPDYFLIKDKTQLMIILLLRILFLLFSILYFFRLKHMPSHLYTYSTIYELAGSILFWGLFFFYEHPNVVIHQEGLIVIILGIFFIIPNRFVMKLVLSFLITIGFFYIALSRNLLLLSSYSWGLLTFSAVIIAFCALTTRQLNKLQRLQFQNTLALIRISTTDTLTGASNRMKYDEELEKEISRSQRYQLPLSGIMFDLDNFKQINDEFGHLEGDQVLIKLTTLVNKMIRENDQFFRWGGEEFIILMPNSAQDSALQLAYRIQNSIKHADLFPIQKLSASFGVTSLQKNDTATSFTERLDQLQYQAKKQGKDQIVSSIGEKIE